MWWLTQARPSRASANVFLSSAPTASSGGASATGERRRHVARASGARSARRGPPSRRCACGSAGRGAGTGRRSPRAARSASSSSYAIGSSDTLPLVITSGTPTSASSRWCSGEYGQHHARDRASAARPTARRARPSRRGGDHDRPRARNEGSRLEASADVPRSTSVAAVATSRTISANGRSSRCLRARSRATTASSSARHARWNPPTPLTATMAPASSAWAAAATASARRRRRARPRRDAADARAGRTPGRRSAGRGSGGRAGRRTRPGRPAHIVNAGHRRPRAVVGDAGDDREARAAVGAVDERVAVAAVGGVEQLGQAGVAGRDVGRDRGVRAAVAGAGADREAGFAGVRHRDARHRVHVRQRRRLRTQPLHERLDGRALDLDQHAVGVVEHEPRQPKLDREPVDEGPEPDALHDAGHPRADPHASSTSGGTRSPGPPGSAGCAPSARSRRGRRAPRRRSARRRSPRTRSSPARAAAPRPSAAITFADDPEVDSVSSVSPARPCAITWREKIASTPMSLAIAVSTAGSSVRSRARRPRARRSATTSIASVAEPPLPKRQHARAQRPRRRGEHRRVLRQRPLAQRADLRRLELDRAPHVLAHGVQIGRRRSPRNGYRKPAAPAPTADPSRCSRNTCTSSQSTW